MPNNVLKIQDYRPSASDIFFFDNNIWMYILCPLGNYQKNYRQKVYSGFYSYLLSRQLHIYTLSLVLSEFSNRYLRLDYDIQRNKVQNAGRFSDYKRDYVGSPEFISTVGALKSQLNQLVKSCQKSSDEFNSLDFSVILRGFQTIGFNDSYYATLAAKKNWIIVSDDSDFTKQAVPDLNLKILTFKN